MTNQFHTIAMKTTGHVHKVIIELNSQEISLSFISAVKYTSCIIFRIIETIQMNLF